MRRLLIAVLCLLALCTRPALAETPPSTSQPAPQALPHLGADIDRTSVSGLSSGGFMAVQYAVAFSKTTIGAGIVAGGPYGCGILGAAGALNCMAGKGLSPSGSYTLALNYQTWGMIDPLATVRRQRIYLFHGKADKVVAGPTMAALRTFYADLKVPDAQVKAVSELDAGHAFLSPDASHVCDYLGPPFINRCATGSQGYDQPSAILRHIFGAPPRSAASAKGMPIAFDQSPYASPMSSLDKTGYLYVPAACKAAGAHCGVHVVFHGCEQAAGVEGVGDKVYSGLGYNKWAEAYGLIMLYPQTTKAAFNPHGCWDWWGYDMKPNGAYLTRNGTQLSAIHRMVRDLATAAD